MAIHHRLRIWFLLSFYLNFVCVDSITELLIDSITELLNRLGFLLPVSVSIGQGGDVGFLGGN